MIKDNTKDTAMMSTMIKDNTKDTDVYKKA